ncbi:hypothetical protein LEP1GSC163_3916 [Leptospira santarosai str. CBC379]|nr:hypothetical protein LEP1GSC163_3916 [Leptospira santarosai str. CBC379]EPG80926.1 hypothetical protein LEP1GSC048_2274 [Leptospira santarosai serovar Shermani str. 1342KT]
METKSIRAVLNATKGFILSLRLEVVFPNHSIKIKIPSIITEYASDRRL